MEDFQVADDVVLRVDRRGNILLMQMNTLVSPAIAVSVVTLRASRIESLVAKLEMVLRERGVRQIA